MNNWKPIPLALKILSVLLLLWAAMSIAVLVTTPERQIAFYGFLLKSTPASIIILILDVISPLVFLYALWNKLKWGAIFGMAYNGVFIINNIIALFMFKEVFGNGIYFPLIISTIFFSLIYKERKYFN